MSEGLSIEGGKIFYDGQQVGIITIPEGTSLHANVIEAIKDGYDLGYHDALSGDDED